MCVRCVPGTSAMPYVSSWTNYVPTSCLHTKAWQFHSRSHDKRSNQGMRWCTCACALRLRSQVRVTQQPSFFAARPFKKDGSFAGPPLPRYNFLTKMTRRRYPTSDRECGVAFHPSKRVAAYPRIILGILAFRPLNKLTIKAHCHTSHSPRTLPYYICTV